MLRGLTCVLGAIAALVLTVPVTAAAAGPVDDAVAGLRDAPVFVHPQANRRVDVQALERAIGDAPIKIAILPKKSATEDYPVSEIRTWPRLVSQQLPGHTIATISGRRFYAGSDVLCRGLVGQAASRAIYANEGDLDSDENSDLTRMLTDFVVEVRNAERCEGAAAERGDRYADEPAGVDTGGSAAVVDDTATVLPWVISAAVIGVAAVGGWVLASRRAARARAAGDRDRARQLVDRLGAELTGLPDGPARVDAAGKHGEALALLAGATTDVQFAAVRHAAIEGLTAASAARAAAGYDPGEPVPAFGPSAAAAGTVSAAVPAGASSATVPAGTPSAGASSAGAPPAGGSPAGLPHQPLARYAPGAPHFHLGSAAAPAGWYPEPFWTVGTVGPGGPGGTVDQQSGGPFGQPPHHT